MSNIWFAPKDDYYIIHRYDGESKYYIETINEHIELGVGLPPNTTLVNYQPPEGMIGLYNGHGWTYVEDITKTPRWYYNGTPVIYYGPLTNIEETTTIAPPEVDLDTRFLRFNVDTQTWSNYARVRDGVVYKKVDGTQHTCDQEGIYDSEVYTKNPPSDDIIEEYTSKERVKLKYIDGEWKIWYDCKTKKLVNKETLDLVNLDYDFTEDMIPDNLTFKQPLSLLSVWDEEKGEFLITDRMVYNELLYDLLKMTEPMVNLIDYTVESTGETLTQEMRDELLLYRKQWRELLKRDDYFNDRNEYIGDIDVDDLITTPSWIVFNGNGGYNR